MSKFHDKPLIKRGLDENLRELQGKLAVAFGNMIVSRLELEENGYVQCGKLSPLHFAYANIWSAQFRHVGACTLSYWPPVRKQPQFYFTLNAT